MLITPETLKQLGFEKIAPGELADPLKRHCDHAMKFPMTDGNLYIFKPSYSNDWMFNVWLLNILGYMYTVTNVQDIFAFLVRDFSKAQNEVKKLSIAMLVDAVTALPIDGVVVHNKQYHLHHVASAVKQLAGYTKDLKSKCTCGAEGIVPEGIIKIKNIEEFNDESR